MQVNSLFLLSSDKTLPFTSSHRRNMAFFNILCIVLLSFAGVSRAHQSINNSESRLMSHILKGYNPELRPVKNSSTPVNVKIGLMVKQIISVDFSHQILTLHVWIRMFWKDEFITWKPEDYDGLDSITVDSKNLWVPDIALYNSASTKPGQINFEMLYRIIVGHTGDVKWSSPAIISSECKINVKHFPFDEQQCLLEFGSWVFHGGKLDVFLHLQHVDKESYSENEEWLFYDSKAERRVTKYNCCPEPYPTVVFTVMLKRRAMYYMLNLIIPCGLITIVSLFSFILPPNSGERVSLVITILLALSVYMMIVTESMPHSAVTPLASKFFLFVMVQQGLSLVATCFIIRFHNNDTPLPKWFDVLVNKWMARLLWMYEEKKSISEPEKDDLFIQRSVFVNKGSICDDDNGFQLKQGINKPKEKSDNKENLQTDNGKLKQNFDKLFGEVKVLSDKIRKMSAKEKLQNDWMFATTVLDRFFLSALIISICIAFLSIFLAVPESAILK
ncbi:neuronal acetylcholine receptor subunit alpha-9 [Exaiptasia diaphana]|uniref:Uncharacterized protein n=1 Tax=Exaiptasia diaphana TaxID=2652724 RepID=A0A913XV44_EXADI|nr:neuronal acetylcholine receptor subunit alpha-9 [Exaiptasia diaphana]